MRKFNTDDLNALVDATLALMMGLGAFLTLAVAGGLFK